MRVAFVSTYPPRRCGIATFTADLIGAVREADSHTQCRVAAIDERNSVRAYGSEVRWRIKQGSALPYRAAAREIDRSNAEIVCVQHEFGLYGLWKGGGFVGDHWIEGMYEDHLTPFLEELKKPALVNMHTVLPDPSPAIREAVRAIAETAHGLVVMAETAVDILDRDYGIKERPLVIPHGMPHIEPKGRRRLKAKLGLDGRTIVSTFGLVGPGKGLEYAIEAMPAVAARHPEALYLIAGQTHPELLKTARRGVPQPAADPGRGARPFRSRVVRQPVPRPEGHHRVPARDRRLRDALSRPEPDHERHLVLCARRRQGRRLDPVPARAGGAREGPGHPGGVPVRRIDRRGGQRDPGRPQAQGSAREERLHLREPGHLAQDRRPVPGRDAGAGRGARAQDQATQGGPDPAASGAPPQGEPAAHPAGPRSLPTGVRGDLHDQPRGRDRSARRPCCSCVWPSARAPTSSSGPRPR